MHNLRRFYYQNKTKVWKIILIVAFVIILIQIANYITSVQNKDEQEQMLKKNNNSNTTNSSNNNTQIVSNHSAITGESLSEKTITEVNKLIEVFISYCNNKEIEKAYEIISDECKKELYPNIEIFNSKYIKINFPEGIKKIAKIENWIEDIYRINITEDIISTGKIDGASIQDYITIVKENNQNKLNINSYIGNENINKETIEKDIKMKILSKKVYMDYEEYTLTIENNSENTILLDSLESTKNIYVQDENENKYYAYTQEIIKSSLKINSGFSTQIKIKFYRTYSSTRQIERLVFSDLILNYNEMISDNIEKYNFEISL